MKFWWRSGEGSWSENFLRDFSPLRDRPKTICFTISQNVMDGFRLNLVDRLGVWREQVHSILVKIWIRIQNFLTFFKRFFIIERSVGELYRFWLTLPHVNEWGIFSDLLFLPLKLYPPFYPLKIYPPLEWIYGSMRHCPVRYFSPLKNKPPIYPKEYTDSGSLFSM